DPLVEYSDQELYKRFRFDRESILLITDLIRLEIQHDCNRSRAIKPEIQVCIALRYLASNSYQITIADTFGSPQAAVSTCVDNVTWALANHINDFVKFPISMVTR